MHASVRARDLAVLVSPTLHAMSPAAAITTVAKGDDEAFGLGDEELGRAVGDPPPVHAVRSNRTTQTRDVFTAVDSIEASRGGLGVLDHEPGGGRAPSRSDGVCQIHSPGSPVRRYPRWVFW